MKPFEYIKQNIDSYYFANETDKLTAPSKYISKQEISSKDSGVIYMYLPLIKLFTKARELKGSPIVINSGYRTEAYQEKLDTPYPKASISPHSYGAALDLGKMDNKISYLIDLFTLAAKSLKLDVPRFGHSAYNDDFLHMDIVFMLFKPYTTFDNPFPDEWKSGVTW